MTYSDNDVGKTKLQHIYVIYLFGSLIYEGSAVIAIKILMHSELTQHPTAIICQITINFTFQKHHP